MAGSMNTEFKSIKAIAYGLFFLYKILGVITIPMITALYVLSTANVLSSGNATNSGLELVWAWVYAICFEMNGLRLIIDGAIAHRQQHGKEATADYIIGSVLVILGTITTFIDGLVNAKIMIWSDLKSIVIVVLVVRSAAVIAMIIRECIHYAPLLIEAAEERLAKEAAKHAVQPAQQVTNINVNLNNSQTNQTAIAPGPVLPKPVQSQITVTPVASSAAISQPGATAALPSPRTSNDLSKQLAAIPEEAPDKNARRLVIIYDSKPDIDKVTAAQLAGCSPRTVERWLAANKK